MSRALAFLALCLLSPFAFGQGGDTYVFKEYQPIPIHHSAGATVQVLETISGFPIFLDEEHFVFYDKDKDGNTFTVWCAPPGHYIMNSNGVLAIVHVTVDGKPPKPPTDPDDPDVPPPPPDGSQIAKDVYEMTQGLPLNSQVAAVFTKHAKIFSETEGNVTELFNDWRKDMQNVLGEGTEYGGLRTYINNYINEKWPMSNDETAYFFGEVAKGLKL